MKNMYFVIPCHNEEKTVFDAYVALNCIISNLKKENLIEEGKILFVDDASTDATYEIANKYAEVFKLKKNLGQ